MHKKYALFLGRYQPPHKGHEFLIQQALDEGLGALILVRDCPTDERNPITAGTVAVILSKRWENHDVQVMVVPDISTIRYGRTVGYSIEEVDVLDDIKNISATEIRRMVKDGDPSWKDHIDRSIQDMVELALL